jgi:hypothetical protein
MSSRRTGDRDGFAADGVDGLTDLAAAAGRRRSTTHRTASAIRVLMLLTAIQPDVVEYLDTGGILAHDATGRIPLVREAGSHIRSLARRG